MARWHLFQPRDWVPLHLEEILYRTPDGSAPVLTGTMLRREARPDCHLIAVGRRNFYADVRDVFPVPGWRAEREMREQEQAEDLEEPGTESTRHPLKLPPPLHLAAGS